MNDPIIKLSIVVPFYNVEKYIAECLESVYDQDIPESDYEVICVNDCSPDNSKAIVVEFQKKHSNLILLEHEQNKMLGAARNTGLRAARGKYVWFIDSDDFIKPDIFLYLIDIIEKNCLDILHFDLCQVTENGKIIEYFRVPKYQTQITEGIMFLKDTHDYLWNSIIHTPRKLFRKSYLLNHNFTFPEGTYFEDNVFGVKSAFYSQRFLHIDDTVYYYRNNMNSITRSYWNGLKWADRLLVDQGLFEFSKEIKDINPDFSMKMKEAAICGTKKSIKPLLFLNHKDLVLFYEKIKTTKFNELINISENPGKFILSHPLLFTIILYPLSPVLITIRKYYRKIRYLQLNSREIR